jgi:Domain of unknown function (DUF1877)
MSMIGKVLGLSPAQIKALRADPSLAARVAMAALGHDEGDLSHFGVLQEPLDLHKSWHTLHYVFTGSVFDVRGPGAALLAGEERLHDAKATQEFAHFLAPQDVATLQARVKVGEMADMGIYGGDDEEVPGEVAHYFEQLRDYVSAVARANGGLLVYLT